MIRKASAATASSSARQTSRVGSSPFRATTEAADNVLGAAPGAASDLRILTPFRHWPKQQGPRNGRGPCRSSWSVAYFSEELIEVNLVFRLEPRPLTTAMIASEMPAAISPYSMAVAPDSFFTKRAIRFFIDVTPCDTW